MLMPQAMEKKETMEGSAFMRKKHRKHITARAGPFKGVKELLQGWPVTKKGAEAPLIHQCPRCKSYLADADACKPLASTGNLGEGAVRKVDDPAAVIRPSIIHADDYALAIGPIGHAKLGAEG
jgi:hypothetical protein